MLTLLLMSLVLVVSAENCLKPANYSEDVHQELLRYQLQFSLDLLKTTANPVKSSQNVFLSPSSVHDALLLTYFSAGGNTSHILQKLLRIPNFSPSENTKYIVIMDYISSRPYPYISSRQNISGLPPYILLNANRMYVSNESKVQECMKELFPKELQQADFAGEPARAAIQINDWVAEQTKYKIIDVLPVRSVTPETALVIVNAAYFKGYWLSAFNKSNTYKGGFKLADGKTVEATFMKQRANVTRMFNEELQADILELPYVGDDINMFILLPFEQSSTAIPDLLNQLTAETLLHAFEYLNQTKESDIEVVIPKFTVEQELNLTKIFSSMGAGSVFNGPADFSDLFVDGKNKTISLAVQKAVVQVEEYRTEAAASTITEVKDTLSIPFIANRPFITEVKDTLSKPFIANRPFITEVKDPLNLPFIANRPFIFTIYNNFSKTLLFTGIFNSPFPEVK